MIPHFVSLLARIFQTSTTKQNILTEVCSFVPIIEMFVLSGAEFHSE